MRIGQQTIIVYLSKLLGSVIGFVGFVFVTNRLGADVIGQYNLVLALSGWITLFVGTTVSISTAKRVSEDGTARNEYFSSALVLILAVFPVVLLAIVLSRRWIYSYTGLDSVLPIVALVVGMSLFRLQGSMLQGQGDAHLQGLLEPVYVFVMRGCQVLVVLLGGSLVGVLYGRFVGLVVAAGVAVVYVRGRLVRPTKKHVRSLVDFSKYVWANAARSQGWSSIDVLTLGLFASVSTTFIGAYGVAWTVSGVLSVFATSLSGVLFPRISEAHSSDDTERVTDFIWDALIFTGLITIPGTVGGFILSDRIITIYGPDFKVGAAVLGPIVLGHLLYDYMNQFLNALNAVDRPDLTMRISVSFLVLNAALNLLFIERVGGIGAAYATVLSAVVSLVASGFYCRRVIGFEVPYAEVGRQVFAAAVMGVVVLLVEGYVPMGEPAVTRGLYAGVLVFVGGVVYVGLLYAISGTFRRKVTENSPL
jgi:O-antigen/teichoic acid export membrane protein